ncbi:MAG: dolichyl-P-Man:Man(5)GlcNAc(2)-PP-dolichol alpha-1,3-mannosyltransferase [Geoglossum simile]|nr:MAG: dolichyl-P-Man:Man(5)GlcNAc(2)-PP-dolichol alpha-1,3-mannosyltransferase [Geoglossum simile]
MGSAAKLIDFGLDLATNPKHLRWLCPLLFIADAFLCTLIVWRVPYTEIDWTAYIEQVTQYINGERDYTRIKGGTGPLVYPAAHVYVYTALYYLTKGGNILYGQIVFGGLYLGTLALVMACYRLAEVPPYVFPLLVLSKRLHSVYLLRLFNDCFAVGALWVAIYAYQKRVWTIGSVAYSWALGIKMSVLLALPAIGIILVQAVGVGRALRQALLISQLQVLISFPFLPVNPVGYFSRAFEFTRVFLFKWTVSWRFVGEERFLSKEFSIALIFVHLALLILFLATRWIRPSSRPLSGFIHMILQPPGPAVQRAISLSVSPQFVLTTILTTNTIGTNMSSELVVGTLAVTVFGIWWGTRKDFVDKRAQKSRPGDE